MVTTDRWIYTSKYFQDVSQMHIIIRQMLGKKLRHFLSSDTGLLATWCEELTHWKRPWCWERLKAGGEGDNRGWDGWMAQWTWVWASSRSWWWTGKPGMLQSMGLQRVGHDWAELNWTELNPLAGDCAEDQRGTNMNKLEDEQVTHLMRGLYIKQWGLWL